MWNRGVMANMLASSAVDHGYEPLSGQTKDQNWNFFASRLNMQNKDWLVRNQDNVSDWGDMVFHGLDVSVS